MKKTISLILCFIMILTLCACGAYRSSAYEEPKTAYASEAEYSYAGGGFSSYANDAAPAEAYAAEESASYEPSPENEAGESEVPEVDPEKIIYSADVTVETTEFESSLEGLVKLIEKYGAFVQSSSINSGSYSQISSGRKVTRNASYVIRVPAANFSTLMSSLSDLGNVPHSNVYTENVTSQYYDTQARLDSLKAQEQRLIELLEKADSVTEIMEIENELAQVRYRIESLQTSLNSWDRQVSYSTVYLELNEVKEYTPEDKVSYGKQLAEAFSDGIESLKDFLLGLVSVLPVLLVAVLLIIGFIKLIIRLFPGSGERREKRRAKKAEKKAQKKAWKQEQKSPGKEDGKSPEEESSPAEDKEK